MKTVIIDPGHGGTNPGAVNMMGTPNDLTDDVQEKNLTLMLAYLMIPILAEMPIKAYLTRTADETVALSSRVKYANTVNADLAISLHFNSAIYKASGFEVFHAAQSEAGKRWAELAVGNLAEAFPDARNRGAKPDNQSQHSGLYFLQRTSMPAILVEPSFINTHEGLMWTYRNMLGIARVLVDSIFQFYGG
jgi:N-acetylmuramoyl-L-alanine amidase